jgi:hypothetical protein
VEYFINTKLQVEIPQDLKHDIACAFYEAIMKSIEVEKMEKEYWKKLYFEVVDEYFKEKGRLGRG